MVFDCMQRYTWPSTYQELVTFVMNVHIPVVVVPDTFGKREFAFFSHMEEVDGKVLSVAVD